MSAQARTNTHTWRSDEWSHLTLSLELLNKVRVRANKLSLDLLSNQTGLMVPVILHFMGKHGFFFLFVWDKGIEITVMENPYFNYLYTVMLSCASNQHVMWADIFKEIGYWALWICNSLALMNDQCAHPSQLLVKTDIWSLKRIDMKCEEMECVLQERPVSGGGWGDCIHRRVMASLLKCAHARDK